DSALWPGDWFLSRSDYVLWRSQSKSFEKMAIVGNEDIALVFNGNGSTERVGSIQGDFWNITNARPILGHLFGAAEPNSVVLTWPLFERAFGGNPAVIGKTIELEGHAFTVAGVLSASFRNLIPQALYPGDEMRDIDAYIPTPAGSEYPGAPLRATVRSGPTPSWFRLVAKRKPGVSFEEARTEMKVLHDRTWKQYPEPYSHDPQFGE
ncbi:MAG: ABC transporter permease, partial [Bryobacteraceae bacterium]